MRFFTVQPLEREFKKESNGATGYQSMPLRFRRKHSIHRVAGTNRTRNRPAPSGFIRLYRNRKSQIMDLIPFELFYDVARHPTRNTQVNTKDEGVSRKTPFLPLFKHHSAKQHFLTTANDGAILFTVSV